LGKSLRQLPLTELWDKRTILFHFAKMNIRVRFQNTYLGFLWAAIEPILYFTILYVVFTSIRTSTQEDFAIYLITGIVFYHIFSRGTTGGLGSLTSNAGILKSLNVSKEFFPVIATIAIGILGIVYVAVFFGLMPVFQFIPSWTIILLPIPLFLMLILVLGLSYALSVINVYARDIQHLWIIFLLGLLFVSPIFWYLDEVDGILLAIHEINPVGQLIEIAHKLVVGNEIPPLEKWMHATLLVFVSFFIGYMIFKKYQNKVVEEL